MFFMQGAKETAVFVHVFVMPFLLVTGNLDSHVDIAGLFHEDQCLGGRYRQPNQNEYRDNGPDDFCGRNVMKLGGNGPFRFTVMKYRPEHHAEHSDAQVNH